jgi:hypothetical protein
VLSLIPKRIKYSTRGEFGDKTVWYDMILLSVTFRCLSAKQPIDAQNDSAEVESCACTVKTPTGPSLPRHSGKMWAGLHRYLSVMQIHAPLVDEVLGCDFVQLARAALHSRGKVTRTSSLTPTLCYHVLNFVSFVS